MPDSSYPCPLCGVDTVMYPRNQRWFFYKHDGADGAECPAGDRPARPDTDLEWLERAVLLLVSTLRRHPTRKKRTR